MAKQTCRLNTTVTHMNMLCTQCDWLTANTWLVYIIRTINWWQHDQAVTVDRCNHINNNFINKYYSPSITYWAQNICTSLTTRACLHDPQQRMSMKIGQSSIVSVPDRCFWNVAPYDNALDNTHTQNERVLQKLRLQRELLIDTQKQKVISFALHRKLHSV